MTNLWSWLFLKSRPFGFLPQGLGLLLQASSFGSLCLDCREVVTYFGCCKRGPGYGWAELGKAINSGLTSYIWTWLFHVFVHKNHATTRQIWGSFYSVPTLQRTGRTPHPSDPSLSLTSLCRPPRRTRALFGHPGRFALTYTLGNIVALVGTFFLAGLTQLYLWRLVGCSFFFGFYVSGHFN